MLWRIFWPSKVTSARSRDNSTWSVTPFNVSYVAITPRKTSGSLCFVKCDADLCTVVAIVSCFGCKMITCHISTYKTHKASMAKKFDM